jgi:hypothetical protein
MATTGSNGARNAQLIKQLRAARTFWHELDDPPRRALQLRRPSEDQLVGWQDLFTADIKTVGRLRQAAREIVVGWRGFTEADVLGPTVGSDAEVEFDLDLFIEWATDDLMLLAELSNGAVRAFLDYKDKKAAAAKN